jgi:outer membrane lipoprotein LolB
MAPLPPVAGRFALRLTDAGGTVRSSSARFEAIGDEAVGALSVYSPVGTTLAQARWSPQAVELSTPGQTRRFDSLETLAQTLFGEPLPLPALVHWLRGQPWPRAPHRRLDAHATLSPTVTRFEQLGWTVDITGLSEGSVIATRVAPPPAVDLRVRLDPPSP